MDHTPSSKPLSWSEIVKIAAGQLANQIDEPTASRLLTVFASFRTNRAHSATPPTQDLTKE